MKKLRKIVVEGIEYKWRFRNSSLIHHEPAYLLIVKSDNPKEMLKLYFNINDSFLLNSGFPMTFDNEQILVNLNQPQFAAQIIHHCKADKTSFVSGKINSLDGVKVLQGMGYEIAPIFLEKEEEINEFV